MKENFISPDLGPMLKSEPGRTSLADSLTATPPSRLTAPPVLCLGEVLFDYLADQPSDRVEQVQSWTAYPGGAPANVACGLVKLGTPAGFIGCVGSDELGAELIRYLSEIGVATAAIQRHPTAPTRQVLVTRSSTGARQFAGFRNHPTTAFADTRLRAAALPTDWLEQTQILVMGTLGLAAPETAEAMQQALRQVRQAGGCCTIDVNWRSVFWPQPEAAPAFIRLFLAGIDLLKLTDAEAEWLLGTQDPERIAQQLNLKAGVLVTAGAKGCKYWLGGKSGSVPAFSVAVVDETGAGDSFLAGFLHQWYQQAAVDSASNLDPQAQRKIPQLYQLSADLIHQMVRYAAATAAVTITKPGAITAQPNASQVAELLHLQKIV